MGAEPAGGAVGRRGARRAVARSHPVPGLEIDQLAACLGRTVTAGSGGPGGGS